MEGLVTGATGFIGSHVARTLVNNGWTVRCLVRPGSSRELLSDVPVTWIEGDVRDLDAVRRATADVDGVFHAAALYALWANSPRDFHAINVGGTRNVLTAAREAGVQRMVHTSSVACVGQAPPGGLANETTVAVPGDLCGHYKKTKHEAEQMVLEAAAAGQEIVIVNPASVIGPGDLKPTPTGKIILDFLEGRMPFYIETGLNFVDVRDVAQGHLLAFERGVRGRRYILGHQDGNKTLREFLELVGHASGRPAPRFRVPYPIAWLAGATSTFVADHITGRPPSVPLNGVKMSRHRMYFDSTRAVTELGLPQTPLEETIRAAVAWFRGERAARPVPVPS